MYLKCGLCTECRSDLAPSWKTQEIIFRRHLKNEKMQATSRDFQPTLDFFVAHGFAFVEVA